jgi:2-polyprenyl-3-methyl-5-hydroxy-6-metoxy-1,4-benzoquinol methylase
MNEYADRFIKTNKLRIFDIDAYSLRGKFFFKNIFDYRKKIYKKEKNRIKHENNFICNLCGHKKNFQIFLTWKKKYQLIECFKCGAITPNISHKNEKEFIDSVYNNPNYTKKAFTDIFKNYEYRKKVFGLERYSYCFKRLKLSKNSKVLDLGCGFGYFLSFLKSKKINCKGIEPQKNIAFFCKESLNIDVTSSKIDEEKNNEFKLITLFDVLEHLKNPVQYFKTIYKKLKIGGYCVIYTPNIRSVSYALMGSDQNTMLPFEHLCFYDQKSIKYLSKKSKFQIYSIETYGFDIMDYFLFKEFKQKINYINKLGKFTSLVQSILDKNGFGNHFRITLKKIK